MFCLSRFSLLTIAGNATKGAYLPPTELYCLILSCSQLKSSQGQALYLCRAIFANQRELWSSEYVHKNLLDLTLNRPDIFERTGDDIIDGVVESLNFDINKRIFILIFLHKQKQMK